MRLFASSIFSNMADIAKPKFVVLSLLLIIAVAAGLIAIRAVNSQKLVSSHSGQVNSNFNQSVKVDHLSSNSSSQEDSSAENTQANANDDQQSPQNGTMVEVNGRKVFVPPNTSYSQTFKDPNGQTSVSVNSSEHSSQSGDGGSSSSNSSSSTIEVNSHSP